MKKFIVPLVVFLIISCFAQNGKTRRLGSLYRIGHLGEMLESSRDWHPLPKYSEREIWSTVKPSIQSDLIKQGEDALNRDWSHLEVSSYMEFSRNGNRSRYQNKVRVRTRMLVDLVMAELIEARGRFMDKIIDGIWLICEQSTWTYPAHIQSELPDIQNPVVALFSAETGAMLSWIYYLMKNQFEKVSPQINRRILYEIDQRILTPCYQRDDFWWMGFDRSFDINNWNPWCNSNWLTCTLIAEQDSLRRIRSIHKIMRSLDRFLDSRPADGGCDEGPSYWNHAAGALYIALEQLYTASNGHIDIFCDPLIKNLGEYINKMHIHGPYFVNFADAAAKNNVDGCLIYRYGNAVGSKDMIALASQAIKNGFSYSYKKEFNLYRLLHALLKEPVIQNTEVTEDYVLDTWLPDIQVMSARSVPDKSKGLYLAAKGGHNDESHNHNDVGSFIIYKDGRPFIIDVGVETYTRKTFSRERYEIWTMNSDYHNLPTINGLKQMNGRKYQAGDVVYNQKDDRVIFSLDIDGAYPQEAEISSWKRKLVFLRGQSIELHESYLLKKIKQAVELNFISPFKPVVQDNSFLRFANKDGFILTMQFPANKFLVKTEKIKIKDTKLKDVWGDQIFRIKLIGKSMQLSDSFVIIFK